MRRRRSSGPPFPDARTFEEHGANARYWGDQADRTARAAAWCMVAVVFFCAIGVAAEILQLFGF